MTTIVSPMAAAGLFLVAPKGATDTQNVHPIDGVKPSDLHKILEAALPPGEYWVVGWDLKQNGATTAPLLYTKEEAPTA